MATACCESEKNLHSQQNKLCFSANIIGLLDKTCKQAVCWPLMLSRQDFVFISIAVGSIYSTIQWAVEKTFSSLLEWSVSDSQVYQKAGVRISSCSFSLCLPFNFQWSSWWYKICKTRVLHQWRVLRGISFFYCLVYFPPPVPDRTSEWLLQLLLVAGVKLGEGVLKENPK